MRPITLAIAAAMLMTLTVSTAGGQEPSYSRKGADSCLSCHEEDSVFALFRGTHANPTDPNGPFGHGQLQCEACHGPTGDHAGRVRRGQEPATAQRATTRDGCGAGRSVLLPGLYSARAP